MHPALVRTANRLRSHAAGTSVLLGALAFVVFLSLAWLRWFLVRANGLDLGIYTQVLWNTAHGHWFAFSVHPHSYLGDHLELGLAALAPFARVFGAVPVLLVTQSLALASAGPLAFALARRTLPPLGALAVSALTLTVPFLAGASLFEFHFLTLALPLLFAMILAYQHRSRRAFLLCGVLLLFVREDLAPVVAAFGLLALLDRRGARWGAAPLVLGTVWFFIALRVIGAFSGSNGSKFEAYYPWLHFAGFPDALLIPLRALRYTLRPGVATFLIGAFGSFAFLPLLAPRRLLPALPLFALFLFGAVGGVTLETHYLVPFVPFLLWAALDALDRIQNGRGWWSRLGNDRGVVYLLAAAAVLYGAVTFGPLPRAAFELWRDAKDPSTPVRRTLVRNLPPNSALAADFDLLNYAAQRAELYSLHYQYRGRRQLSTVPYTLPSGARTAAWSFTNAVAYQALYQDAVQGGRDTGADRLLAFWRDRNQRASALFDGYALTEESSTAELPYAVDPGAPTTILNTPVADGLVLEGIDAPSAVERFPWFGSRVPSIDLAVTLRTDRAVPWSANLLLTISAPNGRELSTRVLPVAYGLYPTVNWPAGERVRTAYRLAVDPRWAGATVRLQILRTDRLRPILNAVRTLVLTVPNAARVGPSVVLGRIGSP